MLVRVSARFELARVRVIGSRLYLFLHYTCRVQFAANSSGMRLYLVLLKSLNTSTVLLSTTKVVDVDSNCFGSVLVST